MLIQGNDGNIDSPESRIPHKVPKRILHFSDGTLEEYSTDDDSDGEDTTTAEVSNTDPATLTWGPWFYYQTATASSKALAACDYMGEALASFFGILSSKYQYEIDEFNRLSAEEKDLQRQQDVEMGGWASASTSQPGTADATTVGTPVTFSQQPTKITV